MTHQRRNKDLERCIVLQISVQNLDDHLEFLKRSDSVMLDHICQTNYQVPEDAVSVQLKLVPEDPDFSVLRV
jgi:hypothetical protein